MKGLNREALRLACTMKQFIDNRYPAHVYEFVHSRAKLDGVQLKKIEMLQLISTIDNDLAMAALETKFLPYEDVAMLLLRLVLNCNNVNVLSTSARIRVALLNEQSNDF